MSASVSYNQVIRHKHNIVFPILELNSQLLWVLVESFCELKHDKYLIVDTQWMTWFCLCSCVVSLPLLVILKEHFYRLDVEMSDSDDEDDDEIDDSSSSQPIEA